MQNADYLVVIELLGHPHGWPYDLIQRSLKIRSKTLDEALESLEKDGVIVQRGEVIRPSDAMRRLNDLNLIAI